MTTPVNTRKPRPLEPILREFSNLGLSQSTLYAIRQLFTRADLILTDTGEVQSVANVSGRTEPLSTTLQNVEATGNFNSLANVTNTSTDHLTDGTGSPLTGGKRAAIALNTDDRITSSLYQVPVSLNGAFTGSNPLTQSGVSTTISVAAWQMQFGSGVAGDTVGGSIDPGSLGTWYVYTDMSVLNLSFVGLTYAATANVFDLSAGEGRICLGKITTAGGGGGTGSGTGGGGNTGVRSLI